MNMTRVYLFSAVYLNYFSIHIFVFFSKCNDFFLETQTFISCNLISLFSTFYFDIFHDILISHYNDYNIELVVFFYCLALILFRTTGLKAVANSLQNILSCVPLTSIVFSIHPYYRNQWDQKLFGCQYHLFCSTEGRKSYRLETTWWGVNNDRIYCFGWAITLRPETSRTDHFHFLILFFVSFF